MFKKLTALFKKEPERVRIPPYPITQILQVRAVLLGKYHEAIEHFATRHRVHLIFKDPEFLVSKPIMDEIENSMFDIFHEPVMERVLYDPDSSRVAMVILGEINGKSFRETMLFELLRGESARDTGAV